MRHYPSICNHDIENTLALIWNSVRFPNYLKNSVIEKLFSLFVNILVDMPKMIKMLSYDAIFLH